MTVGPSRPAYVLGAGFSKAISAAMPITDELGLEIRRRIGNEIDLRDLDRQTFEDWLTLQVTSLPFLEGFANQKRSADAERVITEIARILDERVGESNSAECPLWLQQLVALWHAEQAAVITFNYDTLVERAVNTVKPVAGASPDGLRVVRGDHVVFPAPPAPPSEYAGDTGAPHTGASFQILKLHGSLAWYWAAGDPTGSTLVRVRVKRPFGTSGDLPDDSDFSGATTLDRYLIPPVASKDGYYGSYLANSLWRSARNVVRDASSITLLGYSIPSADRVASQLIAEGGVAVHVVDPAPGLADDGGTILGRLSNLGLSAVAASSGSSCVADYVAERLAQARASVSASIAELSSEHEEADVVVAFPRGSSGTRPAEFHVLAFHQDSRVYRAYGFNQINPVYGPEMPFRERILNTLPSGMHKPEDFLTVGRLRDLTKGGKPFEFHHPETDQVLTAIAAEIVSFQVWNLLKISVAPIERLSQKLEL